MEIPEKNKEDFSGEIPGGIGPFGKSLVDIPEESLEIFSKEFLEKTLVIICCHFSEGISQRLSG